MKEGNDLTWSQVVMAANAPVMTKAALVEGRTDVGVLPTGQVVGVIDSLPTVADIIDAVMPEADGVLQRGPDVSRTEAPPETPAPARTPIARLTTRRWPVALGHPPQQVRHPLVGHAEEVGDARDALPLGPQGHHQERRR